MAEVGIPHYNEKKSKAPLPSTECLGFREYDPTYPIDCDEILFKQNSPSSWSDEIKFGKRWSIEFLAIYKTLCLTLLSIQFQDNYLTFGSIFQTSMTVHVTLSDIW